MLPSAPLTVGGEMGISAAVKPIQTSAVPEDGLSLSTAGKTRAVGCTSDNHTQTSSIRED